MRRLDAIAVRLGEAADALSGGAINRSNWHLYGRRNPTSAGLRAIWAWCSSSKDRRSVRDQVAVLRARRDLR